MEAILNAREQRGLQIAALCKIKRAKAVSGLFRHNRGTANTPFVLTLLTRIAPVLTMLPTVASASIFSPLSSSSAERKRRR